MKSGKKLFAELCFTLALSFSIAGLAACTTPSADDQPESESQSEQQLPVTYSVTFSAAGERTDVTVASGEKVAPIADPVTDDGYAFVGWYTDGAYKNRYDFNSAVTGNITLYANIVKLVNPEFTVAFNDGGSVTATAITAGGRVYDLPEARGSSFVGWFTSDFEDKDKLTAEFKAGETVLDQNVTLYAVYSDGEPVVTVDGKGVSWNAVGANKTYVVTIAHSGESADYAGTATSYAYDFSSKEPGEYVVTVTVDGKRTVRYFNNKALPRVSVFETEGNVLKFNAVEGAERYVVTVDDGDEVRPFKEAITTEACLDVSDYEMKDGGIGFTVRAEAAGRASSVSAVYRLERSLDPVSIAVSDEKIASWNAVEGAEYYVVSIGDESFNVGNATSYSLKTYAGNFTAKVKAVAHGYNSSESEIACSATVAAPSGLEAVGGKVTWNAVEGATKYKVRIGNAVYETTATEYDTGSSSGAVSVMAIAAGGNSVWSDEISVVKEAGDMVVTYKNGVASWSAVAGAESYTVSVNGGEETEVSSTSAQVALTDAGENVIRVTANGGSAEAKVTAYAVTLDYGRGQTETVYLASGEVADFAEGQRPGYTFNGWYTKPDGGARYNGYFGASENKVYYADYTVNKYNVTLNLYADEPMEESAILTYDEQFVLPVPESGDARYVFGGWYAEPNKQGDRYTDESGVSVSAWKTVGDKTLYAGWLEAFRFNDIDNGAAYSVSKGEDIAAFSEITVPTTYNGKKVTTVEGSAFLNCTNLVTINIPDSVKLIETGTAFLGCSRLKNINVTATSDNDKGLYTSVDGMIIYDNPYNGKELKYVPLGKTGRVVVPEGVETLPVAVMKSYSRVTEVVIPYTVTKIDANAFYLCTSLTSVEFAAVPDGETAQPLTCGEMAFRYCRSLVSVTLPARFAGAEGGFPSLFTTCTSLQSVSFEAGNAEFTSKDGVVCNADGSELLFCPAARAGEYTIPVGVTTVGAEAFKYCKSLTSVIVPEYVATISSGAFEGCTAITSVGFTGDDSLSLSIGARAFYDCSALAELTLPERLNVIGTNAFGGTSKLTAVTVLSKGELDFATSAFLSVDGTGYLKTLNIGKDVGTVSVNGVFSGKTLTAVNVDPDNNNYYAEGGVLYNKAKTSILYYPGAKSGAFVLPEAVVEITDNVFENRTKLSGITIGKNVTVIGEAAFKGCTALTAATFSAGTDALVIKKEAFSGATKLNNLVIPARTTGIGENAFKGCTGLKVLSFEADGASPLAIGSGAFNGDTNLTGVKLPARLASIGDNAFNGDKAMKTLEFDFDGEGVGTLTIGVGAFAGCFANAGTNASVTLSPRTVSVGAQAFKGDSYLKTFTFNDNLVEIGDEALASTGIASVNIPASVEKIGSYEGDKVVSVKVFDGCNDLAGLTVSEGNGYFAADEGVLYGLTGGAKTAAYASIVKLSESVTIPSTVTEIAAKAFYGRANLKSVTFAAGDRALTIGTDAFASCEYLVTATLAGNIDRIPEGMFNGDVRLASVNIPGSVASIGNKAFMLCKALSTVTFEDGSEPLVIEDGQDSLQLGRVATGAFLGCESLTSITLPERLTKIGAFAFASSSLMNPAINTDENSSVGLLPIPGGGTFEPGTKTALVSIAIPANVTEIGDYAFDECIDLTTVTFAASGALEKIGDYAFYRCTSLEAVAIPASVKEIGVKAFFGEDSLSSLTIENGAIEKIGDMAFGYDPLITSFVIPANTAGKTVTLGERLFLSSEALTSVTISDSVASIDRVFRGSSVNEVAVSINNENISADGTMIYNRDKTAIRHVYGTISGDYTVPASVEIIADSAFEGQSGITSLVIPSTVRTLGANAFKDCTGMTSVTFEDNGQVAAIGDYAFSGCSALASVNFGSGSAIETIGRNAFASTALVSVTTPASLRSLGQYAFSGVKTLKTATLNEGLESLGTGAYGQIFSGCSALENVTLPSTLTVLGARSFENCTSLKEITVPASLKTVGTYMFSGCTALEKAVISGEYKTFSMTSMFQNCKALKEVVLPDTLESIGSSAFSGCEGLEAIALPSSLKTLYGYVFQNCTSLREIIIPDGVTSIDTYTFDGCTKLEKVVLPSALTTIYGNAFRGCSSLSGIDFPSGLVSIGASAFENSGLTSVTIPEALTTIGTSAFGNCTNILRYTVDARNLDYKTDANGIMYDMDDKIVLFPAGKTGELVFEGNVEFEQGAFSGTTGITRVVLPEGLTAIPNKLFQNSTGLTEIVLPESLAKIGDYAFDGCVNLVSVPGLTDKAEDHELGYLTAIGQYSFRNTGIGKLYVPATVTTFGNYAFSGNKALKEAYINEGDAITLTTTYLFQNCSALVKADVGRISDFGNFWFSGCSSLEEVTLNPAMTKIPASSFVNCSSLKAITIPAGVKQIMTAAFNGCTSLTSIEIPAATTNIMGNAFQNCTGVKELYVPRTVTAFGAPGRMGGNTSAITGWTAEQKVYFGYGQDELPTTYYAVDTSAVQKYWYSETEPTGEGNFWHFGEDGKITVW